MRYLIMVLVALCWLSAPAQSSAHAATDPTARSATDPAAHAGSPLLATADYPQDYFRDPLNIPMSLAANFGELRDNHYHMGLDIRTQHRENLPVYASAVGYVARVQVGPFGFGQAIYINHPNGYTTVYGHLNRFFPALAAYIEQQQYKQQSWRVDLVIPPGLFPVQQGQQIAWSGNTGGSQGPHLHFEIRLTREDVNLNPLLFGLPVDDRVAPKISRVAWYDGNQGIYEQSPHYLPVQPRKSPMPPRTSHATPPNLPTPPLVVPVSRIGFAISASDAQSGSSNPNGIYRAELYDNGRPVIGFQMDHISYTNTQNINAHIDYKTRITGGPLLQQLFFLPGYPFPSIYRVPRPGGGPDPAAHPAPGGGLDPAARPGPAALSGDTCQRERITARPEDGWIDLSDGRRHSIIIVVADTRGNTSRTAITVEYRPGAAPGTLPPLEGEAPADTAKRFYPGMVDGVETADYAFFLSERSLYDSARISVVAAGYPGSGLSLPGGLTPVYSIGARWIPLLDPMLVRLRLPDSTPTARIVMVCFKGDEKEVRLPEWQGLWASARFGEFGNFQLVADTIPPVITPAGPLDGADLSQASQLAFRVRDNLGAIRRVRTELDGQWLCFTNDKGLAYIYKFDGHCPRGPHTLKVTAEDVAGNRSEAEYHFNR